MTTTSSATSKDRLQQAIHLAKSGNPRRAYEMLRALTIAEPKNLKAWVWLSTVAVDLEEQIAALENAQQLAPRAAQIKDRLEALYVKRNERQLDKSARLDELYAEALSYLPDDVESARVTLLHLVDEDETRVEAWYKLAEIMTDAEDRIVALENVLALRPDHKKAAAMLKSLKRLKKDPLSAAKAFEAQGDITRALLNYERAALETKNDKVRKEAQRAVERIKALELAKSSGNMVFPVAAFATNLLVATVVYVVVLLPPAGFNPLAVQPLFWLGLPVVMFGAVLMALAGSAPLNPLWTMMFGPTGLLNSQFKPLFYLIGAVLVVLPIVVALLPLAVWLTLQF